MPPSLKEPLQHKFTLNLASGARLQILYSTAQEKRWIFSYDYRGTRPPGESPDVFNAVRLVADYTNNLLEKQLVLSMHVVIPRRLGQKFFVGVDISPGAKTYLEFHYANTGSGAYRLIEICKGARDRMRLDDKEGPAIVQPIPFPFPVPDRMPIQRGWLQVPFRTDVGDIAHFNLPEKL